MPFPAAVPDPIEVYGGETLAFDVEVSAAADTPFDLTGWTVTAQWRQRRGAPEAHSFTIALTDADAGHVSLSLPSSVTSTMTGAGVWDVRAEKDGVVKYLAQGTTKWVRAVTR